MTNSDLRLGVNIDHVATARNARGGSHPDLVRGACGRGGWRRRDHGASSRGQAPYPRCRHRPKEAIDYVHFEMATDEMVSIACEVMPNAACIVPERREEVRPRAGLLLPDGKPISSRSSRA